MSDTYCSDCGTKWISQSYPRTCHNCDYILWGNPSPVVVLLQPVFEPGTGRGGLGIARRAIRPHLGEWALLGGHVNHGENIEEAALREWKEETGLGALHRDLRYIRSFATPNNKTLVAFEFTRPISTIEWNEAKLCPENSEFGVLWNIEDREKLCFPFHRWLARNWFAPEEWR